MTKDEAIDSVLRKIGNRTHLKTNGSIEDEMVLQQEQCENRAFLPWFLLTLKNDLVVNAASISVPTGFIREAEDVYLTVLDDDAEPVKVIREDYDILQQRYKGESAAIPKGYALVGTSMYFFPTPDKSYTGTFQFYKSDTSIATLTGTQTNLWLTHASSYLVLRTARTLALNLQNPGLVESLITQELEALQALEGATIAREVAARQMQKRD